MARRVAYLFIIFIFLALIGTTIYVNDMIPGKEPDSSGFITGNVVSEFTGGARPGFFLILLVVSVAVIYLVLLNKRRNILGKVRPEQYAGLAMRLTLGISLIVLGIHYGQDVLFLSIVEAILGIILVLGIFVRPAAFIAAFFFLFLMFMPGQDLFVTTVLFGVSVSALLAGGGPFGIPIARIK